MSHGQQVVAESDRKWVRGWAAVGLAARLVLVISLAIMASVPAIAPAHAADPTPTTAIVDVAVGGDRTAAGGVTGVAGTVLGLVPDNGDGVLSAAEFAATPTFTCVSDGTGLCEFTVSGDTSFGVRYWVKQVSAPSGWLENRQLRTGPAGGGAGSVATPYAFLTPAIMAGQRYVSGSNDANGFMRGAEILNGPVNNSTGTWQQTRINPTFPSRCGLRVALIMDWSTSMAGHESQLRGAADAFVDALAGTPSSVAVFNFSTTSPLSATVPNRPDLMPVSTQAGITQVKNAYRGFSASGSTNWDQAFRQAANADQHYDLAIMLTDGNPTSRGPTGQPTGTTNRFAETEDAIFSANELKHQGTRVVALGVGSGVTDSAAALNLAAISGPTPFDGSNAHTADYFQTPDFTAAASALRELALEDCEGTLTVVKGIVLPGQPVSSAVPAGPGWDITVSGNGFPQGEQTTTTDRTGAVGFDLTPATQDPLDLAVTEAQHSGYQQVPVDPVTGALAICTAKSAEGVDVPLAVGQPPPGTLGFTVQGVPRTGITTCTLVNQAPEQTTSITVNKQWEINGQIYQEGAQPDGFNAVLGLTDPSGAPMPTTEWGQTYSEYTAGSTATISETSSLDLPGCTQSQLPTVTGADGVPNPLEPAHDVTLDADPALNVFMVTNYVSCTSHLTLLKQVRGGPAAPESWQLTATPTDPTALPGFSGATGVSGPVTPEAEYVLAESGGDPRYAQADERSRDPAGNPIVPGSTGSWTCTVSASGTNPETRDYVDGIDGSVHVPLGQDVECVAVNSVATLNVAKDVDNAGQGTAVPSDWHLTFTPTGTGVPPGLEPVTVTGDSAGTPLLVRPGTTYALTESGPADYTMTSFTCSPDRVLAGSRGVVLTADDGPDAQVRCTATNTYDSARLTLVKRLDPPGPGDAPENWTLHANGPTPLAGATGSAEVTGVPVAAGTYALSESGGPADAAAYRASPWQCTTSTGDPVPGATADTVPVGQGAAITCVITNAFIPAGPPGPGQGGGGTGAGTGPGSPGNQAGLASTGDNLRPLILLGALLLLTGVAATALSRRT